MPTKKNILGSEKTKGSMKLRGKVINAPKDYKGLSYFACPIETDKCGEHNVIVSRSGKLITNE